MAEQDGQPVSTRQVLDLFRRVSDAGFEIIKTENLFNFDGQPGYSLGQGQ
jgi:isocitrate dehydrogenase